MSTQLTPTRFREVLTAEGITTVAMPGWETHNRDAGRTPLTPNGIVIHHTGSDTTDPMGYAKSVLWPGYSTLPGPLCQAGGAPNGDIYLIGHGRCNHAGGGDQAVLDLVIADKVPMDRELKPNRGNSDGVDGNSHFYGLEVMFGGGHPMATAQYNSAVRFATALCREHGWGATSVIAHREWSKDKPDPGMTSMVTFRKDVADALALPAGKWRSTAPAPAPAPNSTGDFMATMSDAEKKLLLDAANEMMQLKNYWRRMYNDGEWNNTMLKQIAPESHVAQGMITEMSKALAALAAKPEEPDLTADELRNVLADALAKVNEPKPEPGPIG